MAGPPRIAAPPGAYLRVREPGDVGAGDDVTVLSRPDHGITLGDAELAAVLHHVPDRDRAPLTRTIATGTATDAARSG